MTATQVAQHLEISVRTLDNWVKWYYDPNTHKPVDTPVVPAPTQEWVRGPRYWTAGEVKALEVFKAWVPKGRAGVMGETNSRYWGERGRRANKNRV